MFKRIKSLSLAFVFTFVSVYLMAINDHANAKVTIKVTDDEGKPIEGADAGIHFERIGQVSTGSRGITNLNGEFTEEGESDGKVSYGANKEGYYHTGEVQWLRNSDGKAEQKNGKWQPWNPTYTVVLKKKINPVPMYAKWVEVEIPELNKEIGYDFIVGDWVEPYGKGKVSDVLFESIRDDREGWKNFDCLVKMKFPNNGDGIQSYIIDNYKINMGSKLRMPHNAPENNYLREIAYSFGRTTQKGPYGYKSKIGQNYFIRIRTKVDENGNVIKSMYGKIHDDIIVNSGGQRKTLGVSFVYYINPDFTRNIEFDPKKNLLIPLGKEYDKEYNACTNLAP